MIRSLMRFATWRLTPDGDPDAAPPTFRQACDVCGESSDTVKDRDLAVSWALRHAGRRPPAGAPYVHRDVDTPVPRSSGAWGYAVIARLRHRVMTTCGIAGPGLLLGIGVGLGFLLAMALTP